MAWNAADWYGAMLGPQLSPSWLDAGPSGPSWVQQNVGGMGETGTTADALRAIYQGWSPRPAVGAQGSDSAVQQLWQQLQAMPTTGTVLPARGSDPAVQQLWQQLQAMPTTGTVLPAPPALEREVARQRAGLGPQGMSPDDWALMQRLTPQLMPGSSVMPQVPQVSQGYVPGQFAPNLGQLYRQPWGMR